jgi:hypothetical protein
MPEIKRNNVVSFPPSDVQHISQKELDDFKVLWDLVCRVRDELSGRIERGAGWPASMDLDWKPTTFRDHQ